METVEYYLNGIGAKGSEERLKIIASMDLGERSNAAKRAYAKRLRRRDLMNMGFSYENSVLIVNNESSNKL